MSNYLAWLRLFRISASPTVITNVLMGYWLAHGGWQPIGPLVCLLLASTALYTAGMVFNDIADVERDRVDRPTRPLPSGLIQQQHAQIVAWLLVALGIGFAFAAPLAAFGIAAMNSFGRTAGLAVALLAAILSYDFLFKSTALGPLLMGLCRALNICLAMSTGVMAGGQSGQFSGWGVAVAIGVYVMGVTWVARHEASGEARRSVAAGGCWILAALAGLLALGWLRFNSPLGADPPGWVAVGYSVGILLVAGLVLGRVIIAWRRPHSQNVQNAVKWSLLALPLLDAILCFAASGGDLRPVFVIVALMGIGWLAGRKISAT